MSLSLLTACSQRQTSGDSSATAPPPATSASSSDTPFPCSGWPQAAATVYDRASLEARRFGVAAPGDPLAVVGRSADGWWAIAPGTAQAANVGPFRLRWLPPGTALRLAGRCGSLPQPTSPPPGVCFEMAMGEVPLRAAPDPTAPVRVTLPAEGYVAVTRAAANGWLQVDAGSGSAPGRGAAFVAPQDVNVNGPCDPYLPPAP